MNRRLAWIAPPLLLPLLAGVNLLRTPGLLGSPGGEVYGHAWVQWWHGEALPRWPAGTDLASGADRWPVIDPLPTLLGSALGRLAGPVFGYNAWILLCFPLAFAGGALLARRAGGDPLVGGLALALCPALAGSLSSGLTEDGALGLAAVGLALVGSRGPRAALAAGAALGLLAWCGLVLAWYAALAAIILGFAALLRDRRALPTLLGAALLALLLAAPLALGQGERLAGSGHRSGTLITQFEPLWRINPWRGADLLSFFAPGRVDAGDALVRAHPAYLGFVPLLLAIYGRWSRWWAVLVPFLLLAPGREFAFAGHPTGVPNPFARLADALPLGALLNHHGRAMLIAGVALAALAARGAARLPAPWRIPAAIALSLELLLLSPAGLPLPVAPADPPAAARQLAALPPGAVLPVPVAGPGISFQRPLFDQRAHGRPLPLSPNRPGLPPALQRTEAGRWLGGLAFPRPPPAPARLDLPAEIAVILAYPGYAAPLEAALGPPAVRGEDGSAAWPAR